MDNTTYKYASIYAPTDYSTPLVSNNSNGKGMALLDFLGIGESLMNAAFGHYENNRNMHFQQDMAAQQMEFANEQRELTQEYNTSEREATQAFNEMMYNKNNAYNSPQAQMQRAIAAGINPNSFAQTIAGGNSQAVTSSPQSVGMPGMPGIGSGALGHTQLIDPALINANLLAQSQIELNQSQSKKTSAETNSILEDVQSKAWQNFIAPERWEVEKAEIGAQVKEHIANADYTAEKKRELTYTIDKLLPLMYLKSGQELKNLKKAFEEYNSRIALLNEQRNTEKAQQGVLGAQQDLLGAQKENVEANTEGVQYENTKKRIKAQVADQYGIDVDDLSDENDKWISTSSANGTYDDAVDLLEGNLADRAKKNLIHGVGNVLKDPVGAASSIMGARKGKVTKYQQINNHYNRQYNAKGQKTKYIK